MGQMAVGSDSERLEAVLGSCVGVVLFSTRKPIAALAHVVLPSAAGRVAAAGKFADTAIPEMLRLLGERGVRSGLAAKLVGGATMFGRGSGPFEIGEANSAALERLLAAERIAVIARDLGGSKGRRISVDCQSGRVEIEIVGGSRKVL